MTKEKQDAVALWQPSKFEKGSDLLPAHLPRPAKNLVGRENVAPKDIKMPQIKLLHGISKEVAKGNGKPGVFFYTATGELLKPPLRLYFIYHNRSRAYFPGKGTPPDNRERCISRDGKYGNTYGYGPAHECERCELNKWREAKVPPHCIESNNFVVLTELGFALMRFGSSNYKAGAKIVDAWLRTQKNLFDHPVILGVGSRKNADNQEYFYIDDVATEWAEHEDVPPAMRDAALQFVRELSELQRKEQFTGGYTDEELDSPAADDDDLPF